MRFFERILVGLSTTPIDRDLLGYVRLLGELGRGQSHFTFLHVLPPVDQGGRDGRAVSLAEARTALATSIEEHFGSVGEHDVLVVSGDLVDVLLSEAAGRRADLVVVGHRKKARGRRSLSRRLALKAPASVWMVPEGSSPRITSVLTAVDLSTSSAQALSMAALVAQRAGLRSCIALHVQPPSTLGYDIVARENLEDAVERFLSPLDLHNVSVVRRIEESGSVSAAVAAEAESSRSDLVVVGTRGRSRSAAVLLGSESEQVLVESKVPVLITKEAGERVGVLRALLGHLPHFAHKTEGTSHAERRQTPAVDSRGDGLRGRTAEAVLKESPA